MQYSDMASAASPASLQFGHQLVTSLIPAAEGGIAVAGAAQAVLSPLSVWFALVLLLNGVGLPSPTYNEVWKVVAGGTQFGSSSTDSAAALGALNSQVAALRTALARQSSGDNVLKIADGVWTKGIQLNPAYTNSMKALFKAEVASVPDAGPINAWADRVTNGLIPQVVSPALNFNMVLTNAVYFKGVWEYPFEKSRTSTQAFGAAAGSKGVKAQMMTRLFNPSELRGTAKVAYAELPGKGQAIWLPYKGSASLAAVFVLPSTDAFASVADAAKQISGQMILDPKGLGWAPLSEPLALSLPRFKAEVKQLSLKEVLKSMGVRAAFDQPDLSRASASPLVVTDVLQSAVVRVDESGTEAAAATAVITLKSAMATTPPKSLVFNRPFLFFLVDGATQTVLFQGAITNPNGSS